MLDTEYINSTMKHCIWIKNRKSHNKPISNLSTSLLRRLLGIRDLVDAQGNFKLQIL